MKNHFIFPYAGNKREEVETIIKNIDISQSTIIVEPFCGTSALSVYISKLYPKKYKYILNDNDKNLIELYKLMIEKNKKKLKKTEKDIDNILKNIKCKEDYIKILSKKDFNSWFIAHKIYTIRSGLYDLDYKYNEEKPFKFENYEIFNFLQNENITILNEDAIKVLKDNKDNKEVFMFIDPPYLNSCNEFYSNEYNTNIYEYIYHNDLRNMKFNFCLVLEKNWIINLLFEKYKKIEYDKMYQTSKKKTKHLLITK